MKTIAAPTPAPYSAPAITSDGQCTPTPTLLSAMRVASGIATKPARGIASVTTVAIANALALCSDGIEPTFAAGLNTRTSGSANA